MNRSSMILLGATFAAACTTAAPRPFHAMTTVDALPPAPTRETRETRETQEPEKPREQRQGAKVPDTALSFGLGIMRDPDADLLAAAADFPLAELWTVGPAVEVGVDDDFTLVAPMVQFKRYFPINSSKDFASRLLPFVQGGAGVAFLDVDPDGPNPGADDEGLLLSVGGGVRYMFNDKLGLGSQVQFNFLPGEVLDERTYTSWQIAQLVLTF